MTVEPALGVIVLFDAEAIAIGWQGGLNGPEGARGRLGGWYSAGCRAGLGWTVGCLGLDLVEYRVMEQG